MTEMVTSTEWAQLSEVWRDQGDQTGPVSLERDSVSFIFHSKFNSVKDHFIMISLVFTISLKGNRAAPSHIYIFTELRFWDKAFLLMIEGDAVQLQIPTLALTRTANKAASPCLSITYLPHLVKPHKLSAWNFRFLILNIVYCSSPQPATQEGSILFLLDRQAGQPYGHDVEKLCK